MSPALTAALANPEQAAEGWLAKYRDLSAKDLLRRFLVEEMPGRIAMVSSFGTESAVLLHMIADIDKSTPIIFINTLKLFGETLRYRDQLVRELGLTDLREVQPEPLRIEAEDPEGMLFLSNPDRCCHIRKTLPLQRALQPFAGWITGRKRYQASTRSTLEPIEHREGKFKINPLADWTQADVESYMESHGLPHHPLEADGYPSIGCMPCTDRVRPGEDARAGRWRGADKVECGIHLPSNIGPSAADGI